MGKSLYWAPGQKDRAPLSSDVSGVDRSDPETWEGQRALSRGSIQLCLGEGGREGATWEGLELTRQLKAACLLMRRGGWLQGWKDLKCTVQTKEELSTA